MPPRLVADINPRLLRWARESSPMTVEQAANRLRMPVGRIQSWESGDSLPTVRQAQAAARAFGRPFALLFLPEPPAEEPPLPDFRRLPGGGHPELSPELGYEIRRAHFRRDAAIRLREALEINPAGPEFLPLVDTSIEADAMSVRRRLGVSMRPHWGTPYDALNQWKDSIEAAGVLVFHYSKVEVAEARGFAIASRPMPAIGLNGADSAHGRIFTLLHEYAHVLTGDAANCNLVDYFEDPAGAQLERLSNAFAAAVLMPRDLILGHETVERHGPSDEWADDELAALSTAFRVSREAILRRLLTFERTSLTFYRTRRLDFDFHDGTSTGGGFMTWPQRAIRSAGHLFSSLIVEGYRQELITTAEVAELFGVRIKHLPAIEERLGGRNMLTGGLP